jgi:hypothetical protein
MLQVRIFDAQTKVREEVPDSLNFPTLRNMCLCARVIGSLPRSCGVETSGARSYILDLCLGGSTAGLWAPLFRIKQSQPYSTPRQFRSAPFAAFRSRAPDSLETSRHGPAPCPPSSAIDPRYETRRHRLARRLLRWRARRETDSAGRCSRPRRAFPGSMLPRCLRRRCGADCSTVPCPTRRSSPATTSRSLPLVRSWPTVQVIPSCAGGSYRPFANHLLGSLES